MVYSVSKKSLIHKFFKINILHLICFLAVGTSSAQNGSSTDDDIFYDKGYLEKQRDDFIETNGNLPIGTITTEGLKKTDPVVVLSKVRTRSGEPLKKFNPHEFVNVIKKMGIFSSIRIEYEKKESSADIIVHLKEKWTILPIPYAEANKKGMSFGAMIMDSNFLGLNKKLIVGGTYSSVLRSAMAGYVDPSVMNTNFVFSVFTVYKYSYNEFCNPDGDAIQKYKSDVLTPTVNFGYKHENRMTFSFKSQTNIASVDGSYNDNLNAPESQKNISAGIVFKYDGLNAYEYLFYGLSYEIEAGRYFGTMPKYKTYNAYKGNFNYSSKAFSSDRVMLSGTGYYSDVPDVLRIVIGSKPGFYTLPSREISSDRHVSLTLTYEYLVAKFGWGAVTLNAFWEQGAYHSLEDSYVPVYGPGVGAMVYLKNIAFPAMGLNIARSLPNDNFQINVSMGYQF